jgi:hypothetical protein
VWASTTRIAWLVRCPGNADHDVAVELLAPVAENEVKPVVVADSGYADGATRQDLDGAGFQLDAKRSAVETHPAGSPRTASTSTWIASR